MGTRVVKIGQSQYDVYIGRAGKGISYSKWGNPFPVEKWGKEAIPKYRVYAIQNLRDGTWTEDELLELDGKRLGCFCAPKPCHGDVLVWLINLIKTYRKIGVSYAEHLKRQSNNGDDKV